MFDLGELFDTHVTTVLFFTCLRYVRASPKVSASTTGYLRQAVEILQASLL